MTSDGRDVMRSFIPASPLVGLLGIAPASASDLTAHARVLRRGRKICHAEASVTDATGTPVAHAVGTYQLG